MQYEPFSTEYAPPLAHVRKKFFEQPVVSVVLVVSGIKDGDTTDRWKEDFMMRSSVVVPVAREDFF